MFSVRFNTEEEKPNNPFLFGPLCWACFSFFFLNPPCFEHPPVFLSAASLAPTAASWCTRTWWWPSGLMTLSRSASTSAGCVTGRKRTECSAALSCKVRTRFALEREGGVAHAEWNPLRGHIWKSSDGGGATAPWQRKRNQCVGRLIRTAPAKPKRVCLDDRSAAPCEMPTKSKP